MLTSIHADRRDDQRFAPFARSLRWLRVTLAVPALALIAVMIDVQVVRADEYAARPHLGVQADGGRRFEYNPRLLDVARELPRGTIYDRNGLALASADPKAIASARPAYRRLGVSIATACATAAERC